MSGTTVDINKSEYGCRIDQNYTSTVDSSSSQLQIIDAVALLDGPEPAPVEQIILHESQYLHCRDMFLKEEVRPPVVQGQSLLYCPQWSRGRASYTAPSGPGAEPPILPPVVQGQSLLYCPQWSRGRASYTAPSGPGAEPPILPPVVQGQSLLYCPQWSRGRASYTAPSGPGAEPPILPPPPRSEIPCCTGHRMFFIGI